MKAIIWTSWEGSKILNSLMCSTNGKPLKNIKDSIFYVKFTTPSVMKTERILEKIRISAFTAPTTE